MCFLYYCNLHFQVDRLDLVYDIIHANPAIRFNDIMRLSKLKNGTLTHYITKLEDDKKINAERSPRISRFYDVTITPDQAHICKYLTRPTLKNINALLLEKGTLTFPEIRNQIQKSSATISVCLNDLFKQNIITKTYDIPSNKYSLKDPEFIQLVIKTHFQDSLSKLIDNKSMLVDI